MSAPCRRHRWMNILSPDGSTKAFCDRCGTARDETRSRRGKSSSRMGKEQERRAERVYGWEKIGERGEGTDLRGRFAEVQQKSTRRAPPTKWTEAFRKLDATREVRVPLLLLSYVHQGMPTQDFVVMRGQDYLDLHGRDQP